MSKLDQPDDEFQKHSNKDEEKLSLSQLILTIIKISTPLTFAQVIYFLVNFASFYFIGNLDDSVLLTGIGTATMLINILAFSTFFGLNGALETLVSQSYGAKSYEMCGVYLIKGRLIDTVLMLPISLILINSKNLLVAMK